MPGRLPKPLLLRISDVAVPLEDLKPNHARVRLEALLVIVEKRADRTNVERGDGPQVLREYAGKDREDGCFGLPTSRRSEHYGVAAVENRIDRQLLDGTKRAPAQ